MQHGSINPAEHRRVGTDGDRQHDYCTNGETGFFAQLPQGQANVLKQSCHDRLHRICSREWNYDPCQLHTVFHTTKKTGDKKQVTDRTILTYSWFDGDRPVCHLFFVGEQIFTYQPRSFLIVGSLDEFIGAEGIRKDRYRSFELFRRNTLKPEIVTFDELYEGGQVMECGGLTLSE
jgi:hypothetical protein